MESLHQHYDPPDESQSDALTGAREPPRSWKKATNRNYWAKLDQRDFARFPAVKPLPYLEESRLFEQAQNGDIGARNILWRQHLRLAFSVVNGFHLPQSLLADAIQEAAIGLVRAIEQFEVHRYLAFSTYAWYWMEQRVRRFQIDNRYAARIPAYLYTEYHRFHFGLRRCRSGSDWFDWREEWLSAHPRIFARLSRFHRLAHPGPLDDALDLACRLPDPASTLEHMEIRAIVRATVDRLPAREAHIIVRRYGLDGEPEATLKEIGHEIGLTRERVRQLEVETLDGIRRDLEERLAGRNGKSLENCLTLS